MAGNVNESLDLLQHKQRHRWFYFMSRGNTRLLPVVFHSRIVKYPHVQADVQEAKKYCTSKAFISFHSLPSPELLTDFGVEISMICNVCNSSGDTKILKIPIRLFLCLRSALGFDLTWVEQWDGSRKSGVNEGKRVGNSNSEGVMESWAIDFVGIGGVAVLLERSYTKALIFQNAN